MKGLLMAGALAFCASFAPLAVAADGCIRLPGSLMETSVSYIDEPGELRKFDDRLESLLRRCLAPVTPETQKAICANGKAAAEQAMRLIARMDEAAKRNALLASARLKSYKTSVALLEHMKKLSADKTCP